VVQQQELWLVLRLVLDQGADVLLADEVLALEEVEAVVVHENDVPLIIDSGGHAAGGLHLDPPLAVGVVMIIDRKYKLFDHRMVLTIFEELDAVSMLDE